MEVPARTNRRFSGTLQTNYFLPSLDLRIWAFEKLEHILQNLRRLVNRKSESF
jgi:hypothetical protein